MSFGHTDQRSNRRFLVGDYPPSGNGIWSSRTHRGTAYFHTSGDAHPCLRSLSSAQTPALLTPNRRWPSCEGQARQANLPDRSQDTRSRDERSLATSPRLPKNLARHCRAKSYPLRMSFGHTDQDLIDVFSTTPSATVLVEQNPSRNRVFPHQRRRAPLSAVIELRADSCSAHP